MLTNLRSRAFDMANSGKHGDYPNDDSFNDEVDNGFSEDGSVWTAKDGTILKAEMNFSVLKYKWDMDASGFDREELSDDEYKEFVKDCYDAYEHDAVLSKTFHSPYDDEGEHIGMTFQIMRKIEYGEEGFDPISLPLWEVKFENGDTAVCYPEELFESEVNCDF